MLTGPAAASKKCSKKWGLQLKIWTLTRVNEAFAPVPMLWLDEMEADPEKLNPNGGAIALGHPLGASAGRLMITMMNELKDWRSLWSTSDL